VSLVLSILVLISMCFFGGGGKGVVGIAEIAALGSERKRERSTHWWARKQAVVSNTQSVSVRAGYQYVRCQMSDVEWYHHHHHHHHHQRDREWVV